jgi:hypothetical protein
MSANTDTEDARADAAYYTVANLRSSEIGYDERVTVEFTDENDRKQVMPADTRLSYYSGADSKFSALTVVLTDDSDRVVSEYRAVANNGGDWGDLVYRPTDDRGDDEVIGTIDRIRVGEPGQ